MQQHITTKTRNDGDASEAGKRRGTAVVTTADDNADTNIGVVGINALPVRDSL
jgi:hypothetical protein